MLFDQSKLKSELNQALDSFSIEIKKIRTGKASAAAIESIQVEAYGGMNPLNAVGQVQVEDAMNVKVVVWDKGVLPNVENALRQANLGASVVVEKEAIRLKFNPITEEDRKLRVKELNSFLEEYKIRIRQVRHKYMKQIEDMESVSEDEQKRSENEVQKNIDEYIKKLEESSKRKEEDLLTV